MSASTPEESEGSYDPPSPSPAPSAGMASEKEKSEPPPLPRQPAAAAPPGKKAPPRPPPPPPTAKFPGDEEGGAAIDESPKFLRPSVSSVGKGPPKSKAAMEERRRSVEGKVVSLAQSTAPPGAPAKTKAPPPPAGPAKPKAGTISSVVGPKAKAYSAEEGQIDIEGDDKGGVGVGVGVGDVALHAGKRSAYVTSRSARQPMAVEESDEERDEHRKEPNRGTDRRRGRPLSCPGHHARAASLGRNSRSLLPRIARMKMKLRISRPSTRRPSCLLSSFEFGLPVGRRRRHVLKPPKEAYAYADVHVSLPASGWEPYVLAKPPIQWTFRSPPPSTLLGPVPQLLRPVTHPPATPNPAYAHGRADAGVSPSRQMLKLRHRFGAVVEGTQQPERGGVRAGRAGGGGRGVSGAGGSYACRLALASSPSSWYFGRPYKLYADPRTCAKGSRQFGLGEIVRPGW
ncbi:unnamed protein product [Vitrella brassicaformis CCMP3155]|uniref:Uncharacterized protein n=1 Tax=Vitrella brassicaformis (strain CCMP3155) TaxID=1169540 RepID=A0A0G4ELY1_VITBC|nr:unnamed protein product [Vitrella brassicaformis CCMP3155]|eukprot:CEL97977.1 unnamed protein product [Vitrella brassicaformis CCMP3155]